MSGNVNKVFIVGNLGHDPELRHTTKGNPVTTLSIATARNVRREGDVWEPTTEWHRAVVWGKTAERCAEYLKKGSRVYVEGALQLRSWKDKDGKPQKTNEIQVRDVQFLGMKPMSEPKVELLSENLT